jgi:hypothetical protein
VGDFVRTLYGVAYVEVDMTSRKLVKRENNRSKFSNSNFTIQGMLS